MEAIPEERRRYKRLGLSIPVQYIKIGNADQMGKGSLLQDIGNGGARIISQEFVPLNSKLLLEMNLPPENYCVKGVSRVAWIKRQGFNDRREVGVEFVDLDKGLVLE